MAEYKLIVSSNPFAWYYAESVENPGQRITMDQIEGFDFSDRVDVQVNKYGVVLFYDKRIADHVLQNYWVESQVIEDQYDTLSLSSLS